VAGKTLDLDGILVKDQLACSIAGMWREWDMLRQNKKDDWAEIRKYIFATDTTDTTNSKLPWKNKTTVPKLTQIRDNLLANYIAALFPKRKSVNWVADSSDGNTKDKIEAIENYMVNYVMANPEYKKEAIKIVADYIDMGNCFAISEWVDNRQELKEGGEKVGYVGPMSRRINPLDIVFNPIAPSFTESPKIIRSVITLGELKILMGKLSKEQPQEDVEALFNYMRELRMQAATYPGDWIERDEFLRMDGFTDFRSYLQSQYCEVLTFYGDFYDIDGDKFYKNAVITIADRHKLISTKENPSAFGYPQIFHCGWRIRQDNLWAMGPLDNLVGMQYRLDHIENMKADLMDLITFPPLKIKGLVGDFDWEPMARIMVGDDGDVELMSPDVNALQANMEIENLQKIMEEMAGSPKEAMGFRTPGEKTAYEVQRMENAAGRIFASKTSQLEELLFEPLLNSMLDQARRLLDSQTAIRIFDDQTQAQVFMQITQEDIAAPGKLKPIAARLFAERAERVQNLNAFFQSALGVDPEIKAHFSTIQLALMFEDLLDITDYDIVKPYVRLSEQAQAQSLQNSQQEQVGMEAMTPSGLAPDDYSPDVTAPEMPMMAQ